MAPSLLAMDNNNRQNRNSINWGQDKIADNLDIPKFKSFAPSSLSISPSLVSPPPFSPSIFLDSPVFVSTSNILESPTTAAIASAQGNQKGGKEEENSFFDFSFQTQSGSYATTSSSLFQSSSNFVSVEQPIKTQQETWNSAKPTIPKDFSFEKREERTEVAKVQSNNPALQSSCAYQYSQSQASQYVREQKRAEDGYNWRKYGQKQVKGSENPRSYYKCTYPNCPTRKKVERSLDGQITEIVYKGSHNHPKPQSTRRSSSSHSIQSSMFHNFGVSDNYNNNTYNKNNASQTDSLVVQEDNSSESIGYDEIEQASPPISNLNAEEDDCEPDGKRWKGESETEGVIGTGSRTVREPRIVVQTTSDIDILDDGYRWRKYGQKVVKGNPNPRSYYKCTTINCPVRKHVERASHDMRAVITTYEGKHNHDVPAARGSGYATSRPLSDSNCGSNNITQMPIRPSAISGQSNHSNYTNSMQRTSQAPFTLQMLQNPVGSFGYPVNNVQTQQNLVGGFSRAKAEPNDDSFFDSFFS